MKLPLTGLFSRKTAGRAARSNRRSGSKAADHRLERLEQRIALTINLYQNGPWAVITADNADDVYMQQVASNSQSLFIADNSSFNFNGNFRAIPSIDSLTTVYATNGTDMSVGGVAPNGQNAVTTTSFVLDDRISSGIPGNSFGTVTGTVYHAGNSWTFTNGGAGSALTFTPGLSGPTSNPSLVRPVSGNLVRGTAAAVDQVDIRWSAPPTAASGVAPPTIDVTFSGAMLGTVHSQFGVPVAAGPNPSFSLPVTPTNPGGIVPGTLTGSINVAGNTLGFRTATLFPGLGSHSVGLLFNGNATGTITFYPARPNEWKVSVTGSVDYDTGVVSLNFSSTGSGSGGAGTGGTTSGPQNPGDVTVSANYATYNQDAATSEITLFPGQDFSRELFVEQLTPGSSINLESPILQKSGLGANTPVGKNGVTLQATNISVDAQTQSVNYFDINVNHDVTFLADRSAIITTALAVPVVNASGAISAIGVPAGGGGQGYDDDPANAPTVTFVGGGGSGGTGHGIVVNGSVIAWVLDTPGSNYASIPTAIVDPPPALDASGTMRFPSLPTPAPEDVNIAAAVAAGSYTMFLGDDPSTDAVNRGTLLVSPTGSLSGSLAATPGAVNTPSTSVFVLTQTGDLVVEGTIYASSQSYLLQSNPAAQPLAPFVFTTTSPRSGAQTGLIRGTTVAVTLGNDLPTPEQGSVAANTVNLRTQVASLRVKAATQKGAPLNGPFPYDLTVSELDDISIDAVAASSRAISLSAAGSMVFNASLATAGDLSLRAGNDFTVSAPVSTSRGSIAVTAANVTVNNSLRVLDSASDDYKDDIVLTASAGSLNLTGAVTAVNNVHLVQRNKTGTAGKIAGPSRVVARGLNVLAEGSADLRTDVQTLEGQSGGNFGIDELNDIDISLQSPGAVTLRAGGFDPGANNPGTPNTIALRAQLTDVVALQASAPKGSIAVTTNTAKTLTLGNFAAIGAGTATSMQAAGSVTIRSLAGPVVVADAPLGGGGAMPVRVATTQNLAATFAYNTPGTFASTLTGTKTALAIDGIALRVGDRVLVKDQNTQKENGVYVVTTVGNVNTNWRLSRASDADTSAELPSATFVQVAQGATMGGSVFQLGYQTTPNVSPIAVTSVTNQADAIRTRVATTAMLPGTYSAATTTITSSANGLLPLIDGASLAVGDLVVVRLGAAAGGAAANGIYEVTDLGSAGTPWVLTRALDPNSGNVLTVGTAVTTEGSYRGAVTGQAFLLTYDALGNDPLRATNVTPATNIGSDSLSSTATFVVSSTAGTNDAAGSLGKILRLRQANDTSASAINPNQLTNFQFASVLPGLNGAPAGAIRLTQELPAITNPFAIDGSSRFAVPGATGSTRNILVDGSQITTNRAGQPAANAAEISGFEFGAGSGAAGSAAGGSLANITAGGFAKGAAVKVSGAPGILVNNVVLGRNETGDRLSNRFGVLVTGNGAAATILGSTIVCSSAAGVRVDATAAGVTVAGSTIGATNQNNTTGVDIAGGASRIGVNPIAAGTYKVVTTLEGTQITRPTSVDAAGVYLGQTVAGAGIPAGTVITAINGSTLTLSRKMTATGTANVSFGQPARNAVQFNLNGIVLAGGSNTITNTNVNNNTFDGISITGGTQTIGMSTTRNAASNAVFANGRWGVNVTTAAIPANQKIRGIFFGSPALATSGVANVLGNVAVDGSLAPASLGFNPTIPANSVIVVDQWGNQYARPSSASSASGMKQPWRAR